MSLYMLHEVKLDIELQTLHSVEPVSKHVPVHSFMSKHVVIHMPTV